MADNGSCAVKSSSDVESWIYEGGIILIVFGTLNCFWGLANVCEEYFCPALRILCEECSIPDSVAGATIMAMGTSMGDLLISLLALFVSHSTVGLGTIIGSEIFNHLCICAGCVMSSSSGSLKLDARILTREVFGYFFSLVVLIIILREASFYRSKWNRCLSVKWTDGLIMMLCYGAYAFLTINFSKVCKLLGFPIVVPYAEDYEDRFSAMHSPSFDGALTLGSLPGPHTKTTTPAMVDDYTLMENNVNEVPNLIHNHNSNTQINLPKSDSASDFNIQQGGLIAMATASVSRLIRVCTWPLHLLIHYSIPNIADPLNRKRYVWVILLSVVWLGVLAEGILLCVDILGRMLHISPIIMGLTVSAIGASTPTLWSSVVVSRQGYGDMAISNALGANTFSILVGIGLPWFAFPLYSGRDYDGIEDGGIVPLLLVLAGVLVLFYLLVFAFNWNLHRWMGPLFLVTYAAVIIVAVVAFEK